MTAGGSKFHARRLSCRSRRSAKRSRSGNEGGCGTMSWIVGSVRYNGAECDAPGSRWGIGAESDEPEGEYGIKLFVWKPFTRDL